MRPLVLVGGGGHCRSCIDLVEQEGRYAIAGIVDLPGKRGQHVLSYEIFADDDMLEELVGQYKNFLVTVGQIKDPGPRKQLFSRLRELGARLPILVSPQAYVSPHARVGAGTVVLTFAVINAGARVGENCIINTRAVVEHDVQIGDHCHLATGCLVNGGARIEQEVFVGSGAVVREGVCIGRRNCIGCLTAVRRDIADEQGVVCL